jgi:hypothetical protein
MKITGRLAMGLGYTGGGIALAIVVLVLLQRSPEPSHLGKPLNFWCERLPTTMQITISGFSGFSLAHSHPYSADLVVREAIRRTNDSAIAAIQAMGTNCLPMLMKRLDRSVSRSITIRKFAARAGLIKKSSVGIEHIRRDQALTGILALGHRAEIIAPRLEELTRSPDPWLSAASSHALTNVVSKVSGKRQGGG